MKKNNTKKITYCQAINEAIYEEMKRNPRVFIYGIGVPDHKRIFGTTNNLVETFGKKRCLDTPLAEDGMMGFGIGAAINNLRPINIHIRVDFLILAMNQLVNMASTICYGSGGKLKVPIVVRAIIGRGWGQGFQHSKSLQSLFAHIPGLKVIMPTTPKDAKGLLISAIREDNPVICLEHRWLYWQIGDVPKTSYTIPIGKTHILKKGVDCTVVATSWLNVEALKARQILKRRGISLELIDPRTLSPLDDVPIIQSVNKTKYCIIVDNDWLHCGVSAEIASRIYDKCHKILKAPISRIGFAHTPCPTARHLENEFYPNAITIIRTVEKMLKLTPTDLSRENFYSHENRFKGPF